MKVKPGEKTTQPNETKKEEVADYLTQLKELPQQSTEIKSEPERVSKVKPVEVKVSDVGEQTKSTLGVKSVEAKTKNKLSPKVMPPAPRNEKDKDAEDFEAKGEGKNLKFSLPPRDIILAAVNIVTFVILALLLVRLPKEAQELKKLRNESTQPNDNISLQLNDIELNRQKAEKLQGLFLNDSGVVDFVKDIEGLKASETVTKLSFANQKAVKDQTGNFGIPVIIEMSGNLEEIERDLEKIENLPFLFRPVSVEMQPAAEEVELELKYGGFLYVQDELGQN